MDKFGGLYFSKIKNCDIIDREGNKIGRLLDAIFRKSESGLELSKFTVGGSRWEELLEDIGLKDDVDPVFPISVIEEVKPGKIKLNVAKNDLKSTQMDKDAIEPDELKLSQLSKMRIFDIANKKIGNIIDLKFDKGNFQFIVGDGLFQELAEDLKLADDVDFLLSPDIIETITKDEIHLYKNKDDLRNTFEEHASKIYNKGYGKQNLDDHKGKNTVYFPRVL